MYEEWLSNLQNNEHFARARAHANKKMHFTHNSLVKGIGGERKEGELRRTKEIREKPWRTHRLMNYSTLWTWGGAKIFIHTHNYFREWIPRSKVTSPHFEVLKQMRKEPSAWRRLLSRGSSLLWKQELRVLSLFLWGIGECQPRFPSWAKR